MWVGEGITYSYSSQDITAQKIRGGARTALDSVKWEPATSRMGRRRTRWWLQGGAYEGGFSSIGLCDGGYSTLETYPRQRPGISDGPWDSPSEWCSQWRCDNSLGQYHRTTGREVARARGGGLDGDEHSWKPGDEHELGSKSTMPVSTVTNQEPSVFPKLKSTMADVSYAMFVGLFDEAIWPTVHISNLQEGLNQFGKHQMSEGGNNRPVRGRQLRSWRIAGKPRRRLMARIAVATAVHSIGFRQAQTEKSSGGWLKIRWLLGPATSTVSS